MYFVLLVHGLQNIMYIHMLNRREHVMFEKENNLYKVGHEKQLH